MTPVVTIAITSDTLETIFSLTKGKILYVPGHLYNSSFWIPVSTSCQSTVKHSPFILEMNSKTLAFSNSVPCFNFAPASLFFYLQDLHLATQTLGAESAEIKTSWLGIYSPRTGWLGVAPWGTLLLSEQLQASGGIMWSPLFAVESQEQKGVIGTCMFSGQMLSSSVEFDSQILDFLKV